MKSRPVSERFAENWVCDGLRLQTALLEASRLLGAEPLFLPVTIVMSSATDNVQHSVAGAFFGFTIGAVYVMAQQLPVSRRADKRLVDCLESPFYKPTYILRPIPMILNGRKQRFVNFTIGMPLC